MTLTTEVIIPHGEQQIKKSEFLSEKEGHKTISQVSEKEEFILFGAGPAKLPKEVLRKIQSEMIDYAGTHQSILEISHRSAEFMAVNNATIQKAKDLLNIPDNYKVLFMQGGGTGMFSAIPMNLIGKTGKADYIVTGSWSAKAAKEAQRHGKINTVYPKMDKYGKIPDEGAWKLDPEAAYVYCCANETVDGVEFQAIPETNGVPLVADMSSNIFSRPIDVSKFGVIFGGAQKNIGPSGVTIVIIREDLMGNSLKYTPTVFDFAIIAKDNSLYNTPPSFAIYSMNLVFDWIIANGGVEEMEERAIKKSSLLYKTIDNSGGFYENAVELNCRSRMNIVFRIKNDETLENDFVKEAKALGLLGLKGHRSVGGIRASIYNAVLPEHTQRLVDFMIKFQEKHQNEKSEKN
jgi:phosphoserine aminotransferase